MQEKLIKNSSWSYAAKLAATVLFFAADIVIARFLDIGLYAEWALFYSVLSMAFYFFWFGVNGSAKVFVSKTQPESDGRVLCIQAGIRARTAVTCALTVLTVCAVLIVQQFPFFSGLNQRYPHLHTLLALLPFIPALNSFTELFKEIGIGVQNYRGVFILTVAEYAAILGCGTAGAGVARSPEGAGYGYLLAYALTFTAGLFLTAKWNRIRSFRNRTAECRQCAQKILRYAVPLALIGIGGIILVEMDTVMLGMLSTPENVSDYAIAKQICTKASHINNALATGTLTAFSVITADNFRLQREAFTRVARVNLLVTLATGGAMLLLAGPAIRILYGAQYADAAGIVRLLVPYYILYGLSAFYALFLDFHGKAGKRSLWYLLMVGINLVLNLLLIPRYGTAGACLATVASLIPYSAYLLYATYRLVWKELQKSYEKE